MKRHLISEQASIVEALESLNRLSGETMTLFAVSPDQHLTGSLTDGDIRRALLSGHALTDPVRDVCNRNCITFSRGRQDIGAISKARQLGIELLPVVEEERVVGILDLKKHRGLIPADAVLMAGGSGERLRPLTASTPKPLLPVDGKPIIDHNIALLREFGVEKIFVTVNYLKDDIISHFKATDPEITCVAEPEKLGTIGSLALIDDIDSPNILVMNADLLTDINLEAMYLKHLETEAWLTVAVVPYPVAIPFAIIEHQEERVTGITEKPTFNYSANAGIYLLRREAVDYIRGRGYMDAPDLISVLIADSKRVSLYEIEGQWLDIGSPDDYRRANSIHP